MRTLTLTLVKYEGLSHSSDRNKVLQGQSIGIGRSKYNEWHLPDETMQLSRYHCKIDWNGTDYILSDDGSTGGTYVNGSHARLQEAHTLHDGDRVRMAGYVIQADIEKIAPEPIVSEGNHWDSIFDDPPPNPRHDPNRTPDPTPTPDPVPEMTGSAQLVEAFCRGAGIAPEAANGIDAIALAEDLGASMRVIAKGLGVMFADRRGIKTEYVRMAATIGTRSNNNPLKGNGGASSEGDPIERLFIRRNAHDLDAVAAFEEAMLDLSDHQAGINVALAAALADIFAGLAPHEIEARASSGFLGFRRGRAWDLFVTEWELRAAEGDHGMHDAFQKAFSQRYESFVEDKHSRRRHR